ncbi:MAG: hypothetical protein IT378_20375, partial [Sandaracinaceae bacterium]|nr:hypothetical protein [Sandaracinaceae bacterium]
MLLVLLPLACNGSESWSVAPEDGPERFESLRRRQFLRYIDVQSGEEREWDFVSTDPIAGELTDYCNDLLQATPGLVDGEVCDYQQGCGYANCKVHRELCQANLLEEIASISDRPLILGGDGETTGFRIPAQSTATNAVLHELAAGGAREALYHGLGALRAAAGLYSIEPLGCTPENVSDGWGEGAGAIRYGRSLATATIEALDISREATQNAVRDHLALADGHYSTAATAADAARLASSAPTMSRAHAAHLLIGGEEGLAGFVHVTGQSAESPLEVSFCTANTLSPRGQAALAVLRDAALPPAILADLKNTPLAQVLIGGSDNVRSRLRALYGLDETTLHGTDAALFSEDLGLDLAAFQEAREYWAQEFHAFARSESQMLPARLLAGGTTLEGLYAATALPPQAPLPEFYASLARFDLTPAVLPTGAPDREYSLHSLSHSLDYAYTQVGDLLAASAGFATDQVRSDVLDPLATLAARAARERPARLRVKPLAQETRVELYHDGSRSSSDYVATWSTDVLSCAVRGTIEGQPCSWSPGWLGALFVEGGDYEAPPAETGFVARAKFQFPSRFFWILRRRTGATGLTPAAYEVVVGHTTAANADEHFVPVLPELSTQAGDLLTPSTDLCSHSRETCAGVDFDSRLPLENELSDN